MYVQLLFFACWCVSISVVSAEYYDLKKAEDYFKDFIVKFDKHYIDERDKADHFKIFKDNLERINSLNKESEHAVFAINLFADLTHEEFTKNYTGLISGRRADRNHCHMLSDEDVPDKAAPESLDWRHLNAVTPVKNQRSCGACWAFATVGHIEGLQAIKHKKLLTLSEQQLIDCDLHSLGCDGGMPAVALESCIKMKGNMLEKDYPYKDEERHCRYNVSKAVVRVTDCFSYSLSSQEKVKQLLYKMGPLPIAIKSTGLEQHYHKGIIDDKSCNIGYINHAVLLVGYGTENGMPYWIVKNSWSHHWGEDGYFRMQRSNNTNGACGMLNDYLCSAVIA